MEAQGRGTQLIEPRMDGALLAEVRHADRFVVEQVLPSGSELVDLT